LATVNFLKNNILVLWSQFIVFLRHYIDPVHRNMLTVEATIFDLARTSAVVH